MSGLADTLFGKFHGFAGFFILTLLAAQAGQGEPELHTFLRERFSFSDADLSKVQRGKLVTTMPRSEDNREVALWSPTFHVVP